MQGNGVTTDADRARALTVVAEHLRKAIGAGKCHPCGCLHGTLSTMEQTPVGRGALAELLHDVRAVITPKAYDCLGCAVCYPAIASNALGQACPQLADELLRCPTDPPAARRGWPPRPGDYHIVRYGAPVAVCVLNSEALAARVAATGPDGLAIVGPLHTETSGSSGSSRMSWPTRTFDSCSSRTSPLRRSRRFGGRSSPSPSSERSTKRQSGAGSPRSPPGIRDR
jgi:hypothetical protein